MKKVQLSGSTRENVGKKDAATLRKAGRVPVVVYGGEKQFHVHVDKIAAEKLIYTPQVSLVELDFDGTKVNVIIKEVSSHPVTDQILHIDFIEYAEDTEIKIELPIVLNGTSEGVRIGGKPSQNFRRLKVSALAANLPDAVELDISPLKIGDAIRVRDIEIENVKILGAADAVIYAVKMARGAKQEEETEVEA